MAPRRRPATDADTSEAPPVPPPRNINTRGSSRATASQPEPVNASNLLSRSTRSAPTPAQDTSQRDAGRGFAPLTGRAVTPAARPVQGVQPIPQTATPPSNTWQSTKLAPTDTWAYRCNPTSFPPQPADGNG
ncbi:hypothetical protein B0H10DRAFT_1971142 [Mycena sp. CBHHK59/15]|nr:hypothetical protein B0H10DRAFT_1971142 [Mycena sp. CBHHK59/15]